MIERHEGGIDGNDPDLWYRIAAPLPKDSVSWRQDGRPITRGEKYFARFVAYVDAQTVRERLDNVVPGEWNLTLELLPPVPESTEEPTETPCAFKARLQILGVVREDIGTGRDYKAASTDAFKRAAVRFGIGHELYAYEQNWVQVDGDGKYPKPVEDPQAAYERRQQRSAEKAAPVPERALAEAKIRDAETLTGAPELVRAAADAGADPECPKCGGRMWNNKASKRNPKAPDYKCRDRSCDGVIWPPKAGRNSSSAPQPVSAGDEEIPY